MPFKNDCMTFVFVFSEDEGRYAPPNTTVMVRGLAQHIGETDIREDIVQCNLVAQDIRVIRKKETRMYLRTRVPRLSFSLDRDPRALLGPARNLR